MNIKNVLKKILPKKILKYVKYYKTPIQYICWLSKGKKAPPPHFIKVNTIKKYMKKSYIRIFVETGTCYGDTINGVKYLFTKVFSVELDRKLYEKYKTVLKK